MDQLQFENLASLLSLAVAVVAALVLGRRGIPPRWTENARRKFNQIASAHWLWYLLILVFSLGLNAAIACRNGIAHPFIHDEFSYLLAADTFAHGRLTNPTPPGWVHFETPHELMQPTYMSKYPPAQGMVMAAGQLLTHQPMVGIWISTALASVGIYWMLLGFVSSPWALVGGLMISIHPQLIDWSRVYWGGSVAVLGGAIVLGAWGRLMISGRAWPAILLGVGLIILANSRPYEGALLALPLTISLAWRAIRGSQYARGQLLFPSGFVLLIGGILMGYYNYRITGHALRMPFVEYSRQYDVYPKFWFLPVRPMPGYRNDSLRFVHAYFEQGLYDVLRTPRGLISISWFRTCELLQTNAKMIVMLWPLSVGFFCYKDPRVRWVLVTIAFCLPGFWTENFILPHYEAPCTAMFLLLIVLGLQRLWKRYPWLAQAVILGFIAGSAMADAQPAYHDRQYVEQQQALDQLPALADGRHLIFVEYAPLHSLHNEYIYNSADLASSRIIWARSLGTESDVALIRQFPGRHIWLLKVGGRLDLLPYLTEAGAVAQSRSR